MKCMISLIYDSITHDIIDSLSGQLVKANYCEGERML